MAGQGATCQTATLSINDFNRNNIKHMYLDRARLKALLSCFLRPSLARVSPRLCLSTYYENRLLLEKFYFTT